jgi:hypothetical protein
MSHLYDYSQTIECLLYHYQLMTELPMIADGQLLYND